MQQKNHVFWLLGHFLGVKPQKSFRTTFSSLHSLESYGDFFLGQQLILFVRENYCNCASCGKSCANEFFKHAYKISKSRLHKRVFDVRKWTLRRPIYAVSMHNYAPKVARVIKTPGNSFDSFCWLDGISICHMTEQGSVYGPKYDEEDQFLRF